MKRITIAGKFSFTEDQEVRLRALGEVVQAYFSSSEEWLSKVRGSDVILSNGDYLLENLDKLENVFISYPYVETGVFNSQELKKKDVLIANAQGSNRDSIIEWTLFAALSLFRKFPEYINVTENKTFIRTQSLVGKKVLIVGKGNIGTGIGEACRALKMEVDYFTRTDDLATKSADADLIINALNCTSSSRNLLDEKFFTGLKPGSYYVTSARPYTYDIDAVLKSIDAEILGGAGIDCDPEEPFDTENAFYQKCLTHERVLVTPHIAFATKEAGANGTEMMVKNVEAYLRGEPERILNKV